MCLYLSIRRGHKECWHVSILLHTKSGKKWQRIRAKSLKNALEYCILCDKKRKDAAWLWNWWSRFLFIPINFSVRNFLVYIIVLLFTISLESLLSFFIVVCHIFVLYTFIVPSITFIEPFWFSDWNISISILSNRPTNSCRIDMKLCVFFFLAALNYLKLWTCLYGLFSFSELIRMWVVWAINVVRWWGGLFANYTTIICAISRAVMSHVG